MMPLKQQLLCQSAPHQPHHQARCMVLTPRAAGSSSTTTLRLVHVPQYSEHSGSQRRAGVRVAATPQQRLFAAVAAAATAQAAAAAQAAQAAAQAASLELGTAASEAVEVAAAGQPPPSQLADSLPWLVVGGATLVSVFNMGRAFSEAKTAIERREEGERQKQQEEADKEAERQARIDKMFKRL